MCQHFLRSKSSEKLSHDHITRESSEFVLRVSWASVVDNFCTIFCDVFSSGRSKLILDFSSCSVVDVGRDKRWVEVSLLDSIVTLVMGLEPSHGDCSSRRFDQYLAFDRSIGLAICQAIGKISAVSNRLPFSKHHERSNGGEKSNTRKQQHENEKAELSERDLVLLQPARIEIIDIGKHWESTESLRQYFSNNSDFKNKSLGPAKSAANLERLLTAAPFVDDGNSLVDVIEAVVRKQYLQVI